MDIQNPYKEPIFRKVGNSFYKIKNRFLDKNYRAVYSKTKNEIYYGCSKKSNS